MDNRKEKGISTGKVITIVIVVLIIAIAASYYLFSYYPKQQKTLQVKEYKKILFDSMLCQYNCPLENQTIANKTGLWPAKVCVDSCTSDFIAKNYSAADITQKDVSTDDLLVDISYLMNDCKRTGSNGNSSILFNGKIFDCIKNGLPALKDKYSYLN